MTDDLRKDGAANPPGIDEEAYGMDSRPGPSSYPAKSRDALIAPHMAKKGLAEIKRKATAKMFGQVEEAELMCRMLEAAQNIRRPAGKSAAEALDTLTPDDRTWLLRQARAAIIYMVECLNASEAPQ